MCITPIYIKNPNKGKKGIYKDNGHTKEFHISKNEIFSKYKDNESDYIPVPCGVCKQCIAIAQMELVQRVQMEALNSHIFMATLTYRNETLPRLETPQWKDKQGRKHRGYEYRYAKYEDASAMMKRLRNNNVFGIPFKYLIVTERGSKGKRPHFHILLLFKKNDIGNYLDCLNFEKEHKWTLFKHWQRNIGSRTHPLYQDLCEYRESYRRGKIRKTYDFHYVNPLTTKGGTTDVAFYVLKYMLKGMSSRKTKQAIFLNYEPGEAERIWNRIKDRREYSLGFGLDVDYSKKGKDRTITEEICNKEIIDYLRNGVERSQKAGEEYAFYYCPENLNTFPLANYYKRFDYIYNLEDEKQFYDRNPKRYRWNKLTGNDQATNEKVKQIRDLGRILKQTELDDIADDFDELF